jgi:hypothetical protein
MDTTTTMLSMAVVVAIAASLAWTPPQPAIIVTPPPVPLPPHHPQAIKVPAAHDPRKVLDPLPSAASTTTTVETPFMETTIGHPWSA